MNNHNQILQHQHRKKNLYIMHIMQLTRHLGFSVTDYIKYYAYILPYLYYLLS
jgi:hypothetical protein